ncbi:MAG TPA: NHL repeat-containing protein, partial [Candidatus Didemnitutus sp.]|nr:NHL repeat-containing protein [Candidatus Didemnitutus sp.]
MLVPAFLVRLDAAADYTTPYSFSTLSGLSSVGSSDGPGNVARFFGPSALAIDKANNLYVADEQNNLIRKITPAGVVSTVAGTAGVRGNTNGTGSAALFGNPQGIAIDSAGNLYVADKLNQMVRKITPDGVVTTLAGTTGIIGSGAPDGTPATAVLYILGGIAIDKADNIYVADWGLQVVRKITPAGAVSTFAGQVNVYGDTDGPGETASFLFPIGLTFDSAGSLWVTELGGAVRKISPEGVVSTVIPQSLGLQSVESIAFDPAGVPYLTDMKHVVRRRTAGGALEIFAGTEDVRGSADGTGTAASFSSPFGLAFDSNGNLFVADRNNNTIRKITPAGVVSTFAGLSPDNAGGSTDGALNAAKFESLGQVATGPNGDLYVADTVNFTIRKVARDGTVTTFAGKAGEPGNVDGTGAQARFEGPYGIAPATDGSLFVSDAVAHTIRKVTAQGAVTTLAGSADQPGATDGSGSAARFNNPAGLVVAADGSLFVADRDNHVIRKITSSGAVTTFAGIVGRRGALDGTLGNALFDTPEGLALDAAGNLYVSDSVRHGGIRRISPAGVVTTLAGGAGGEANAADGAGTLARFNEPGALAVNASGTVFVADMGNHAVRMISPAGIVSTTAGMAG